MKALRFHGQKDLRLEDVEIPICGKGQVKVRRPDQEDWSELLTGSEQVKPAYVGICGTGGLQRVAHHIE